MLQFVKITKCEEINDNDNSLDDNNDRNEAETVESPDIDEDENVLAPLIQEFEVKDTGLPPTPSTQSVTVEKDLTLLNKSTSEALISNDPADWIINADLIEYFSQNISSQNKDCDLSKSARLFGTKTRYARKDYFIKQMENGEIITRDWLTYSPSSGNIYCYVCKVFQSFKANETQF